MFTQEVTVNNEVGLHARPATYFIQKANEFKSGIWVEKEERRVNAQQALGHREGHHHHPDRRRPRRQGGRGGPGAAGGQSAGRVKTK